MSQKLEQGWVPLVDSVIPDYFNTEYRGNFANNLQVHQPRLRRFLDIASLDGRVLLTDQPPVRHRDLPNLNSDGSASLQVDPFAKLHFGTPRTISDAAMLQPERLGWRLSIDGDAITDQLREKNNGQVRGVEAEFAKAFNGHFTHGLEVALLRDKLTKDKDPHITGKIVGTLMLLSVYASAISRLTGNYNIDTPSSWGQFVDYYVLGSTWFTRALDYIGASYREFDSKNAKKFGTDYSKAGLPSFFNFTYQLIDTRRRTLKSKAEVFALPIELDRVLLAEGYLHWQKAQRKPLIRLAR